MSHSLKNSLLKFAAAVVLLPALSSPFAVASSEGFGGAFVDERLPRPVLVRLPTPLPAAFPAPIPVPGNGPGHLPGLPPSPIFVPGNGPGHLPGLPPAGGHTPIPVQPRPFPVGHPGFPILRPPVIVVAPRVPGRLFTPPPTRPDDEDEVEVTRVMLESMRGRACDRAGDVLREMANTLMSGATFAARPVGHLPGLPVIVRRGEPVEYARQRWGQHLNSQRFWQVVWERLAAMYRDCNKGCFDDGVAVGEISATGYCSASVAVGGLNAPGFEAQQPLPLCQNETFTGCLVGYDRTASTYDGCSTFTSGGYTDIYNQSKSQDCHMD